jgi:hypothetical protein
MSVPDDSAIGAGFRQWVENWARGPLEEKQELFDEIENAERTGFPWEPAAVALSQLDPQALWKAFDDSELQDLYDWLHAAGIPTAAERFKDAALARPYIDDGKIPADVRALVMKRDGEYCQGCGATEDLTIDHKITPWSLGGSSTDPANLQVLCRSCNSSKGTRPGIASAAEPRRTRRRRQAQATANAS